MQNKKMQSAFDQIRDNCQFELQQMADCVSSTNSSPSTKDWSVECKSVQKKLADCSEKRFVLLALRLRVNLIFANNKVYKILDKQRNSAGIKLDCINNA